MTNKFASNLAKIELAKTEKALIEVLGQYVFSKNLTMFAFANYQANPNSAESMSYFYASPKFKPWKDYRLERGFDHLDEWIITAYRTGTPTYWHYDPEGKIGEVRTFHQEAIEAGIIEGFDLPAHGPNNSYAYLTICNLTDPSQRDPLGPFAFELFNYFIFFTKRFREIHTPRNVCLSQSPLSKRQIQCLKLTALNYSAEAIGKTLGITTSTVNFHIQKALKLLGVQNKYQAILALKDQI